MRKIVILYSCKESLHQFDQVFDGISAFERSVAWASSVCGNSCIYVLSVPDTDEKCKLYANKAGVTIRTVTRNIWTAKDLCQKIASLCREAKADFAVFAWSDCPFLNMAITNDLLETHEKYKAEYTFADGYPYGFAPEILTGTTAAILAELPLKDMSVRKNKMHRDTLFSIIKNDINSFEIETVISKTDWRMYRFSFDCGNKSNLMACKALYEAAKDKLDDAESLCAISTLHPNIIQTVPAFYNVQITSEYGMAGKPVYCPYPYIAGKSPVARMDIDKFIHLAYEMSDMSEQAVIGLSAWGEPLCHPDFTNFVRTVLSHRGMSVLIETDGTLVGEDLAAAIKNFVDGDNNKTENEHPVSWIVSIDGATPAVYAAMHTEQADISIYKDAFTKAAAAVSMLTEYFPGDVYPQLVRTNSNECELEQFYKYWSDKSSPSRGNIIIQKYDWFCGLLPQDKPADLSPLDRNPCWHLRRDMTILADGSVPLCREHISSNIIGNVFTEGIMAVWEKTKPLIINQIEKRYTEKCSVCDEYYTFNF